MTSTIGSIWLQRPVHKPIFDRSKILWKAFQRKMRRIIVKKAPEYLPFFFSMPLPMLGVLRDTLFHWQKRSHIPLRYCRRFLETKVIECVAFWKGYVDMGGAFPPKIYSKNVSSIPSFSKCQTNITRGEFKPLHILVVIPIGFLSSNINEFLTFTLSTLERNASISKIVCVFDGIEPPKNWHSTKHKLEVIRLSCRSGPAHARNIGIEMALNDDDFTDVFLIDSDIILSSTNLDAFLIQYQSLSEYGIVCPKITAYGSIWFDLYHNLSGTLNGRYLKSGQQSQLLFGTTSCMLIPREILQSGLRFSHEFPIAAGEDIDFCLNSYQLGCPIYSVDSIAIPHWYGSSGSEQQNWVTFKERFYRYGKGEALVLQHHPDYYQVLKNSIERI